jgi:hypothetical protein
VEVTLITRPPWKGETPLEEEGEVEAYSRVGSLISILKSKARRSLKNHRGPNGKAH